MNKNEIYADGLAQIHVVGSTVRLDFMTLEPKPNGENPEQIINNRVILPLPAFLTAYDSFKKLLDKLEADGVIKKKN